MWFGKGEVALHKEQKSWSSTTTMTLVVFTQVRATEKRKTLLLLLVDWMKESQQHTTLKPDKLASRELLRVYKCEGV